MDWENSAFKILGLWFRVDLDRMVALNYKEKIDKMNKILSHWKRRDLTVYGKVTVIKSLVILLFNNLFTTLPNPDNNTFYIINKAVYEYLWKGCARIKSTVITKPYLEGGINMINLRAFINSLKVCWIRRCLNSNSNYINLCSQYFDIIKLESVG